MRCVLSGQMRQALAFKWRYGAGCFSMSKGECTKSG